MGDVVLGDISLRDIDTCAKKKDVIWGSGLWFRYVVISFAFTYPVCRNAQAVYLGFQFGVYVVCVISLGV